MTEAASLPDSAAFIRLALQAANYQFNPAGIVHDLTYREMSSTGSLNLIKDYDLRVRLTDYYRLAYRTGSVSQETSVTYSDRVGALVGIPAGAGTSPEDNTTGALPVLDAAESERLIARLRAARELPDELRLLRSHLINEQGWLERLLSATDSLLARLPATTS